jgi:hypothetical protein
VICARHYWMVNNRTDFEAVEILGFWRPSQRYPGRYDGVLPYDKCQNVKRKNIANVTTALLKTKSKKPYPRSLSLNRG